MREQCQICGATIGENNTIGIGGGCHSNIVKPAHKDTFFKFKYLEVYILQATKWREEFLETFKETKFRSAFKKSFYESIKTHENVSKKQLNIIKDQLMYKGLQRFNEITEETSSILKYAIRAYSPENDEQREFYHERFEMYKKNYLGSRKKTLIDE